MHATRSLSLILALFALAPRAQAEDEDQLPPWRAKVDRLVDRWADNAGSGRLLQAHTILINRLKDEPADGEALLTLARVKLAMPPLRLSDPHRTAKLAAENFEAAIRRADRAAKALRLQQVDKDGKQVVLDKGGARYQSALAVGYLGSQLLVRAEARRMELIPNSPNLKALIARHARELGKRRTLLEEACGSKDRASARIQEEVQRLEFLRHVDEIGSFPRPLGLSDLTKTPIDLSKYRGKVLLIVFWSSKLEGTAAVVKTIETVRLAIEKATGGKGFAVLGINLDDRREGMDAFLGKTPLKWRHAFGSTSSVGPNKGAQPRGLASGVAKAWGLTSLPDGVLVDHRGRVRYLRPWEKDLQLKIQELLNRAKRRSS